MATKWSALLESAMQEKPEGLVQTTINPQLPHVPVVLLIDTSSSMAGHKIEAVNSALTKFFGDIERGDTDATKTISQSGDFAVISYGNGDVRVEVPWTHGSQVRLAKPFEAEGDTPMGAAIVKAGELLLDRFRGYRRDSQIQGLAIQVLCGAVFNLTDGGPTDMSPTGNDHNGQPKKELKEMWDRARATIELFEFAGSSDKKSYVQFFHMGAPGFDDATLEALSVRPGRVFAIDRDMSEFFDFVKLTLSGLGQYLTIEDAIQARLRGSR